MSDKLSNTCGEIKSSRCVEFDGTISPKTKLTDTCDPSQHEVNEDLYSLIDDALPDYSGVDFSCLTFSKDDSQLTPKDIIEAQADKICELQTRVAGLEANLASGLDGINILGLDTKCVADACGGTVTLKSVLQYLIDNACS